MLLPIPRSPTMAITPPLRSRMRLASRPSGSSASLADPLRGRILGPERHEGSVRDGTDGAGLLALVELAPEQIGERAARDDEAADPVARAAQRAAPEEVEASTAAAAKLVHHPSLFARTQRWIRAGLRTRSVRTKTMVRHQRTRIRTIGIEASQQVEKTHW